MGDGLKAHGSHAGIVHDRNGETHTETAGQRLAEMHFSSTRYKECNGGCTDSRQERDQDGRDVIPNRYR